MHHNTTSINLLSTTSINLSQENILCSNTLLFISFHIVQTVANQIVSIYTGSFLIFLWHKDESTIWTITNKYYKKLNSQETLNFLFYYSNAHKMILTCIPIFNPARLLIIVFTSMCYIRENLWMTDELHL
jgi:hypothetical protein